MNKKQMISLFLSLGLLPSAVFAGPCMNAYSSCISSAISACAAASDMAGCERIAVGGCASGYVECIKHESAN